MPIVGPTIRIILVSLALCPTGAAAAAGSPQSGAAQAPRPSTGNVAGHVVLDVGGAGMRKVIVDLSAQNDDEKKDYTTSTDAFGQFRIEGVDPGAYTVTLTRFGYLPVQDKAEDLTITLAPGQNVIGLLYKMQATGVIAGKITEPDGDPLPGATVWVTRVESHEPAQSANGPTESGAGEETTNDLGEFRIANLRAGQYLLQAQVHGVGPAPDPADRGKQKDRGVYALTFYPGTREAKTASPVRVTPGGLATANFSVMTSRAFRVNGSVMATATGSPGNTQIFLVSNTGQTEAQTLQEGGKFEFQNILPGTYVAQIVEMTAGEDGQAPVAHTRMIASPIVVTDADVAGLLLEPEGGGSVSGNVRVEEEGRRDWKNLTVSLIRVADGPELPQVAEIGALGGTVSLREDGSFAIGDVAGARYRVLVGGAAMGDHYLKSVQVDGREVVDTGFTVNGPTNLEVLLSAKGASIEGTVVDSNGSAVAGATVVGLPSAGNVGRIDAYPGGETDASGHFLLRGIIPGAYVVVALKEKPEDVRNPEFFQKYGDRGQIVDLGEGDKKSVTVQVLEE